MYATDFRKFSMRFSYAVMFFFQEELKQSEIEYLLVCNNGLFYLMFSTIVNNISVTYWRPFALVSKITLFYVSKGVISL